MYIFDDIKQLKIIISHYILKRDNAKDIFLNPQNVSELKVTLTVHYTDTVSVAVACSMNPVIVDCKGIIRLSNALTRVEERLLRLVEVGVDGPCHCHQSALFQITILGP